MISSKIGRFTLVVTLLVAGFTSWYLVMGNYEFLLYSATLVGLWGLVFVADRTYNYSVITLSLFIGWLVMHLLGGSLSLGGVRLYDTILLPLVGDPYCILKYDQMVHFYCYVVMARLVAVPLRKMAKESTSPTLVGFFVILSASGVGAANEIIEFMAVVFADAGDAVGGYTNTALDICCNFCGACFGWWSMRWDRLSDSKA